MSVRSSTKRFFDFNEIWYVRRWVDDWCMTVYSMTRTKVKVTSPWKSEIWPFSKAISSPIYNGGWQMTTDSYIRAQYLKLIGAGFFIFVLVFVSHDFEVGNK